MTDDSGGIPVGERLRRIELRLETIEMNTDERITRHREANQKAIEGLAQQVIKDIGGRVASLEKHDVAEDAVRSYRKSLVAIGLIGGGGLLVNFVMLMQVLDRM